MLLRSERSLNQKKKKKNMAWVDWRFFYLVRAAVLVCFCGTCATMNVKTALEGETVKEMILKYSLLGKDDQLMAYFQENSTSNGPELCAQYFCDNGQCDNIPASVGQFQVQGDDVVMLIHNVNISNMGLYTVSHNGVKDVCTFTLDVQEATGQQKETVTETEVPLSSVSSLTWSLPGIAGAAFLVLIVVFFIKKKRNCGTNPTAAGPELEPLETART